MNHAKGVPISKGDAYLMGMLSTLNYLIDAPLEEILAEIPLPDEIRAALLTREGRAGKLFSLVLSYERADWGAIEAMAKELEISVDLLTNTYFNCLNEVDTLWRSLMETSEGIPAT